MTLTITMTIMVTMVITITMTIKSKNNRIVKKFTNNCTKARCKMSKRFLLFTVFHLNQKDIFHKCNYKNYQNNIAILFQNTKSFFLKEMQS